MSAQNERRAAAQTTVSSRVSGANSSAGANAASEVLSYTVDATNHGVLGATNLAVTQRPPSGNVALQSAARTGWTGAAAGQVVTCTRATLLVVVAPPSVGSLATTASVDAEMSIRTPPATTRVRSRWC